MLGLPETAGFEDIWIVDYGWPFAELTRYVSCRLVSGRENAVEGLSPERRSIRSAKARPKVIDRVLRYAGGNIFTPFALLQHLFCRADLDDGIVKIATLLTIRRSTQRWLDPAN
jgi:hypothetical protein